jgi:hypothetical protein
MLDAVVDRREMKDLITRVLQFGRVETPARPASPPPALAEA